MSDNREDLALSSKLVDDSHGETAGDLHAVGDGGRGDELHAGDVLEALVESSLVLEKGCVVDLIANLCLRPLYKLIKNDLKIEGNVCMEVVEIFYLLLGSLGTLLCTWSSGHF